MGLIRLSQHQISSEDVASVALAMNSGTISRGSEVKAFEREFASYVEAEYAVMVSSGTAALHLACRAVGVHENTTVAVPTMTFAATANAPIACGANIQLYDMEIRAHSPAGMILVAHYAGYAEDIILIGWDLADDAIVIEDAAHALGARYSDSTMVGSCPRSKMTCFSFHPTKVITTGEGGCITTNSASTYQRLLRLRDNGRVQPYSEDEPFSYSVIEPGLNYWMSEMAAALGRSQLKNLNTFLHKRIMLANLYRSKLPGIADLVLNEGDRISPYIYPILIDFKEVEQSRTQVMTALLKRGIETGIHYKPLHLFPAFPGREGDHPNAEAFYKKELTLPLHCGMSEEDVEYVCSALDEVLYG